MRRSRKLPALVVCAALLAFSAGVTSCGGGGGGNPDLVLIGFNIPNISGVALNQPLIFTFSNNILQDSITPDTLRVVGDLGPNFEGAPVVDGNLVALLPRSPNFDDYSDAGLIAGIQYTVQFALHEDAADTITTPDGKPLIAADSFQFRTDPVPRFIEPYRPIRHGPPPGDDQGCLDNADNSLLTTIQFGSSPGARLLCLKNDGQPEVIWDQCEPRNGDEAVGTPSITPGLVNLPALRVRFNEMLDPLTVTPYSPSEKQSFNIQLWLVGDTDKIPLPSRQIRVNEPLLVQSLNQTEIILVPANEDENGEAVGGVPQGTYLINVTRNVTDLVGGPAHELKVEDRSLQANWPVQDGDPYWDVEQAVVANAGIPDGYRLYFVSLVVPGSRQSIIESYGNNIGEWGDTESGDDEPGVFTYSAFGVNVPPALPDDPLTRIPGSLDFPPALPPPGFDFPSYTLDGVWPGQSTTANWNGAFRFLGLADTEVNTDRDDGIGDLKAVWRPHCGNGGDGAWESRAPGDPSGVTRTLNTNVGSSVNGDGIFEFSSFTLRQNDELRVTGSNPLVIFCRGDFVVETGATIYLDGTDGGPGLDTNGDPRYTHPDSIPPGGVGGLGGAGGGTGGNGANPLDTDSDFTGVDGDQYTSAFGLGPENGGGGGLATPSGGGGGGMLNDGGEGTIFDGSGASGTAGAQSNDFQFRRSLDLFEPDRAYSPYANGSGGTGGGGGGMDDDGDTTPDNGDDGGGGGGGAGGGLYVIACGEVTMAGSIFATGGDGGHTYAVGDHDINLGEDNAPGGTGENADVVVGILGGATPSGAGGPGGGGAGGGIFLCGIDGVTVSGLLNVEGGVGGESGLTTAGGTELMGGAGSPGIMVLASRSTLDIDTTGATTLPGSPELVEYNPTIEFDSTGVSRWYDLFTDTTEFKEFRWESNFGILDAAGLVQGTDFDAILEVQGADGLFENPTAGLPVEADGLTPWIQLNLNVPGETRVSYDAGGLLGPSPIDGYRFMRFRWRFHVPPSYPGWPDGGNPAEPMPAIRSLTVEFER